MTWLQILGLSVGFLFQLGTILATIAYAAGRITARLELLEVRMAMIERSLFHPLSAPPAPVRMTG